MAVLVMAFVPVNAEEPMIVAHRGASRDAPENTIPAFKLAWEQGADAIEGDFHLTTDGHIVCTHDGIGKKTLAELRSLHAARYRGAFKGTTIPTIAEVFSTIPDKKKIFIEIKCGTEIIPALLEEIGKSGLKREQIVVISFKANVLNELKAKAPWMKTSWLCGFSKNKASGGATPSLEKVIETLKSIKADALSSSTSIPDEFIGPIKKQGYEWHVWTVNDAAQARKMKALGAASITTDVPGHMKKQLAPPKPGRGKQILPADAELFTCQGKTAFLALPKKPAPGKKTPWLWYCPSDYNLPGKLEQWMIDKCLTNGIAVAGINLSGDFGTPAGRAAMTAFYQEVTQNRGLTKKACMLARSYGGTQMYNWAAEHPESVACLAGIYPVCNLASYPGLKAAAGKYGMSQEQFVKKLRNHNPIDRLAPLARAKVPIYHNTGDVDNLVPGKDNSFLLAERYKALGGDITVTVFKGQGHNYWTGFFEDKAMAEFIIKHAKRVASFPKVLIIGDSISGGYSKSLIKLLDGKAEVVKLGAVATYRINKEAFWHSSGTAKNLDFGSAKACVADLERFEKHLAETRYDLIHFNFGLNDIFRGRKGTWHNPVDQYAKDLAKIVMLLKTNGAKIIWANTTPIPANDPDRPEGEDLIYNAAAEKVMKKNHIPINDLHSVVTGWDGYAKWKKGNDVHFSGAVYSKLAEQIAKTIAAQLKLQDNPAKE